MITLRNAIINEAEEILEFYKEIIFNIQNTEFQPRWNNEYPNLEFIKNSILNEELYIYKRNETIIASVVVNNKFSPEYDKIQWSINAKPNEIIIIHTFAINPNFQNHKIGKQIFNRIKETALKNNKKTIRIDVIDGNVGAEKVFKKLGFEYIGSIEVFHEAVGLSKFHLYEHVLKKE